MGETVLNDELQKFAAEELREDASIREKALEQMVEWIQKHPYIKRCRTDSRFLLRFLRTKKFSLPQAQESLERYLVMRQVYPQYFRKLDIQDEDISQIIDGGYIFPLPERDDFGRRVIFSVGANFDAGKFRLEQMARVHALVCESLLDDEESQIRGYTHINDESGFSLLHTAMWSAPDIRNMMQCIQCTPMRHKMTHFVHVPPTAAMLFEFFVNLLSDKLKKRVMWHKNLDELKKHVNADILPEEYGGKVPMKKMIAEYKEKLLEQREAILSLDEMEIELNKKAKIFSEFSDGVINGVAGSFRKLEVD